MFMNEMEIIAAHQRDASDPGVPGKAVRFLLQFMNQVNEHSDGWCYWKPAIHSAAKLMKLVAVLKLRGISLFLGFARHGARNGADTAIALSNEISRVEQFIFGVERKGWSS
jgi:hypothetical protein